MYICYAHCFIQICDLFINDSVQCKAVLHSMIEAVNLSVEVPWGESGYHLELIRVENRNK